jgi:hypothetical protein
VDDEADDGEFQIKAGHADAREREDDVLHEEVDDGAPECGGEKDVDAIEERQEAGDGEIDGGGAEGDDEVAEESEGGGFGSTGVGGLAAEDSGGDALEQARGSEREHRAVDDESGGDVAATGDEACEENRSGRGSGMRHVEEFTLSGLDARKRVASRAFEAAPWDEKKFA